MTEAISYGAGVNSTALTILLVERGWRGPVVFADTGAEWPETYCYLKYFEAAYLAPRGLSVTVLKGLPWQKYHGGSSLIEFFESHEMTPIAANRFCTAEWKVRPQQRWRKANGIERNMVGIAAEESHRMANDNNVLRPLVDEDIDRQACVEIIKRAGLDVPQKSGCYLCPFQRPSNWRLLWERHPELFERTARLEEMATARRGIRSMIDPSGLITLRQREAMYEGQIPMFEEAVMDGLLAYRPCVCGL